MLFQSLDALFSPNSRSCALFSHSPHHFDKFHFTYLSLRQFDSWIYFQTNTIFRTSRFYDMSLPINTFISKYLSEKCLEYALMIAHTLDTSRIETYFFLLETIKRRNTFFSLQPTRETENKRLKRKEHTNKNLHVHCVRWVNVWFCNHKPEYQDEDKFRFHVSIHGETTKEIRW